MFLIVIKINVKINIKCFILKRFSRVSLLMFFNWIYKVDVILLENLIELFFLIRKVEFLCGKCENIWEKREN